MISRVYIFDTTLRDGEQSPGVSLSVEDKKEIARALERLRVDVIEAGFPVASPGDFEGVKAIAETVKDVQVAALARANQKDIDVAWEAIKGAASPRIHTFIATSDIHLQYKLRKSREEVLELAVEAVKYAKRYTPTVEFSAEDATRSDWNYLAKVVVEVIRAGAVTVNIPDTVGYTVPQEYYELIKHLVEALKKADLYPLLEEGKVCFSVHCHNDLGLAVANSLSALLAGARQVECTINGIGERAGNAALEEIVMALKTRQDYFARVLGKPLETRIDTRQIVPTSQLVSKLTGMMVQPNKAIVGANAFAHESGIHVDGVLKQPLTYEIMTPEEVGVSNSALVLGKHSGRAGLKARLEELGYHLEGEDFERLFAAFKRLADKKKEVFNEDLEALIADEILRIPLRWRLDYLNVVSGTVTVPTATVRIDDGYGIKQDFASGVGPVDAVYNAIKKITGRSPKLLRFTIAAITGGMDAIGEVTVRLEDQGRVVLGKGSDPDILVAAAKAFLNGLNRLDFLETQRARGLNGGSRGERLRAEAV